MCYSMKLDKMITNTCPDQILFCDRYHIAGTRGVFYSREPYANIDAVHVTRFIGLAPVGNTDKQVFYLTFTKRLTCFQICFRLSAISVFYFKNTIQRQQPLIDFWN